MLASRVMDGRRIESIAISVGTAGVGGGVGSGGGDSFGCCQYVVSLAGDVMHHSFCALTALICQGSDNLTRQPCKARERGEVDKRLEKSRQYKGKERKKREKKNN